MYVTVEGANQHIRRCRVAGRVISGLEIAVIGLVTFPFKVAFLSSLWTKLAEILYTFNLT